MLDINEMRTKIVTAKALQQQQNMVAQEAMSNIKNLLQGISEDTVKSLENSGYYLNQILSVDTQRLLDDKQYLEQYKSEVETIAVQLSKEIETLCS